MSDGAELPPGQPRVLTDAETRTLFHSLGLRAIKRGYGDGSANRAGTLAYDVLNDPHPAMALELLGIRLKFDHLDDGYSRAKLLLRYFEREQP